MDERNKITKRSKFITTPIYYINSKPHLGSVYATLMADIMARFYRLNGIDTYFLTGTDEHGQKIQQSAEKAGLQEQEFTDKISQIFRNVADFMKFTNNDFIRTTEKRHTVFVQKIWRKLVENDWLYKDKYKGWYCVSDEAYYTEDDLVKQEDGTFKTTLGKTVEWREEEGYFFRLSEFQQILLELYKNKDFVQPEVRKNEIIAFVGGNSIKEIEKGSYVKGFLKDLSISRNTFSWGIKIPCDCDGKELLSDYDTWKDDTKDEEKHVIYVWLDALFNYQSALEDRGIIDRFWNNADVIHVLGKDIIRFHSVYWPAFLIATKYSRKEIGNITVKNILKDNILPKTMFAHGFWISEGKKMSKSFGNVVDAENEVEWLMNDFKIEKDVAIDYLKYFLPFEMPFGNDGDYSRAKLVDKINAELANNIGNLIQRVLSMIYKNLGGKIDCNGIGEINRVEKIKDKIEKGTINVFDFLGYKELILDISNESNDYMEKMAPWTLKKENKIDEMKQVLFTEVENIRKIAILMQIICPYTAKKILDFLQVENRTFKSLYDEKCLIKNITISEPVGFFPRLQKI